MIEKSTIEKSIIDSTPYNRTRDVLVRIQYRATISPPGKSRQMAFRWWANSGKDCILPWVCSNVGLRSKSLYIFSIDYLFILITFLLLYKIIKI